MKTGNTPVVGRQGDALFGPQWSPVMKTGNTRRRRLAAGMPRHASMEPGHEDREYSCPPIACFASPTPQWSPVMKTGNTRSAARPAKLVEAASMEPGHEDREYRSQPPWGRSSARGLNGARS